MDTKLLTRFLSILLIFTCIILGIEFVKTVLLALLPAVFPTKICFLPDKVLYGLANSFLPERTCVRHKIHL